jgi:hypothetical protein
MILPKTDHAMIVIAAASLLPNPKLASFTIVPSDAVEVVARATSATIATSGMLDLLSLTPTMADASKSTLFPHCHRIDATFSFLSSMRSCKLATTKKEMCR